MNSEYDGYDIEKSAHYTEQMIQLARRRWGDVPLSPQTYTWSDGTVSVHVKHNICDPAFPSMCQTVRLSFHETGFRDESAPAIRETVSQGVGPDSDLVWETRVPVAEIELF